MEEVTLDLPGRDAKVEQYLNHIRLMGTAGIHHSTYYSTYAHMANGIWSSEREASRLRRRVHTSFVLMNIISAGVTHPDLRSTLNHPSLFFLWKRQGERAPNSLRSY